jgi:hypothetical protein
VASEELCSRLTEGGYTIDVVWYQDGNLNFAFRLPIIWLAISEEGMPKISFFASNNFVSSMLSFALRYSCTSGVDIRSSSLDRMKAKLQIRARLI